MPAGKPLSWVFKLEDEMSGPARNIVINLNQVSEATDDVKDKVKETGGILDTALGTGLARIGEKFFAFGKELVTDILRANQAAERTKIAFEIMTGSVGQAAASFEEAKRVAFALGAPLQEVAASYKEMLSSGEDVTNLQLIAKAASDLAHIEGGSIESWTKAFSDIRGKGELAGRSLQAFVGAVDFDALSKNLGLSTHGYKELTKALTASPVSAQKGIQALLQTIAESQGGSLETVSRRMRDTFSGTIATIKDELLHLFEWDSSDSALLQFLHGVRDALDPDGPLVAKIRAGASAFMEGLGLITGGSDGMKSLIDSLKDGTILGDDFKVKMREVGEDVREVARALGTVASGIVSVSKALNELHGGGAKAMESQGMVRKATEEQLRGSVPISDLAPRDRFGGSWSKAALHYLFGDSEVEKGLRVPRMAEGGRVTGPTLALIGEGGEPETVVPDSKVGAFGGGGVRLHVENHYHITTGLGVEATDLAKALHDVSFPDLQGALDGLAQSMGVG